MICQTIKINNIERALGVSFGDDKIFPLRLFSFKNNIMKTMIENSEKLTKLLNLLYEEADWQPYTAYVWESKGVVKLQGYYSEVICKYLSDNGYERNDEYFVEYHNGEGVEITLTEITKDEQII